MRRLALAAAAALAFALPLQAQAQMQASDTREARLAAAEAYAAMTLADMDVAALVRTMYQPIIDQLAANGQVLRADQVADLDALYQSTMVEPLLAIMRGQGPVMADLFTLEEIEALAAFYSSPVGRSVMTKLPELVAAQQPQIMEMVQREVPPLIPRIQAIVSR